MDEDLSVSNHSAERAHSPSLRSGDPNWLDTFLWGFVGGAPQFTRAMSAAAMPTVTPVAAALSKALKQHGFKCAPPFP